jgi:hypothetical protein
VHGLCTFFGVFRSSAVDHNFCQQLFKSYPQAFAIHWTSISLATSLAMNFLRRFSASVVVWF